jgi:hypothetical protein
MRRWCNRLILNRNLVLRQHPSDHIHELKSALLRPKVYIHSMKLVHVFVLVSWVEGGKTPVLSICRSTAVSLAILNVNSQRDEGGVLVGILNMSSVHICNLRISIYKSTQSQGTLTPVESILMRSPSIVRDLYACSSLRCVLEEVNVGAFVESVMRWFGCQRTIEIMYICKSAAYQNHEHSSGNLAQAYRVAATSSPGLPAIFLDRSFSRKIFVD